MKVLQVPQQETMLQVQQALANVSKPRLARAKVCKLQQARRPGFWEHAARQILSSSSKDASFGITDLVHAFGPISVPSARALRLQRASWTYPTSARCLLDLNRLSGFVGGLARRLPGCSDHLMMVEGKETRKQDIVFQTPLNTEGGKSRVLQACIR